MTRMKGVFAACVLVLMQTAQPSSQTPRPAPPPAAAGAQPKPVPERPARDGEPAVGKSVLRGKVVVADTGGPVRGAQVFAFGDSQRRGSTTTDNQGGFEIRDLPAGRYTLSTNKRGLLAPGADTVTPARSRPPQIEVGEGQTIEKITLTMLRGGVITGRIVDEFGEPVAGAEISALRYEYRDGKRQLSRSSGQMGPPIMTDDLGAFRLYGLRGGDYFLGARPPHELMTPETKSAEGLATTFFPGTPDSSQARAVAVRAGQEASGISFALVRLRLARVQGTALNSRGAPMIGAFVNANLEDAAFGFGGSGGGGAVRADGSFILNGLAPGAYALTVRTGMGMPGDENGEMGSTRLTIAGEDVDGILIAATRGGTVRGRLFVDDDATVAVSQFGVTAQAVENVRGPMGFGRAQVRGDGTFEVKNLFGRLRLGFTTTGQGPPGLTLKGVYQNGEDITDTGVEFTSGEVIESVEIILTRKITEVSGRVIDEHGNPVDNGRVLVFPADETRWMPRSRFFRVAGIGPDGVFRMRGLPPHDDYLMNAVPSMEPGQEFDPEFLRSLVDSAARLSLREAETKTQDLRVK